MARRSPFCFASSIRSLSLIASFLHLPTGIHIIAESFFIVLIFLGLADNFFLRPGSSHCFSSSSETGVKFDLGNGHITGYNFTIYGKSSRGNIIISSDNTNKPLRVGSRFYVDWDGTLYAEGGFIAGDFEVDGSLNGGSIYGATIQGSTISGSNINV